MTRRLAVVLLAFAGPLAARSRSRARARLAEDHDAPFLASTATAPCPTWPAIPKVMQAPPLLRAVRKTRVKTRPAPKSGRAAAVYGEILTPGAARTIVFTPTTMASPRPERVGDSALGAGSATVPDKDGRVIAAAPHHRPGMADLRPFGQATTRRRHLHRTRCPKSAPLRCPTSRSSSAKRSHSRRTWRRSSPNTKTCWPPTSG
jgi:hypothetical protein